LLLNKEERHSVIEKRRKTLSVIE